MKQSLTYYLTLLVIRLKGLKKSFSQDPVDFKKIRKEDVHTPKGAFFKKNTIRSFRIASSSITEIKKEEPSVKLLIFIHGGAFISGPAQHHWDTVKELSRHTDFTIWMCNYPKAPEYKITLISENIDAIYNEALTNYESSKICLIGDSVGGTLITALTQRLIIKNKQLPYKIILVCPVMDASMTNPEMDIVDKIDPMLSKVGLLSAKKMCIEDDNLKNTMISPLYGSFNKFPETIIYAGTNDITYPDQILAIEKLRNSNVKVKLTEGKNMPHIWPFLPVMKEAKLSLKEMITILNTH